MARSDTSTCATCYFWCGDATAGVGDCRRQPPTHASPTGQQWPRTTADCWCGEYKGAGW